MGNMVSENNHYSGHSVLEGFFPALSPGVPLSPLTLNLLRAGAVSSSELSSLAPDPSVF